MSTALPVELDDIQGLVRFGYKHHTEASFLLLRVNQPAAYAGKRFLGPVLLGDITDNLGDAHERAR